jgi:endoglucanase
MTGTDHPTDHGNALSLNDQGYLETRGLNVMLADDFYPQGHQGGLCIIQNGSRVATNGDLRLERSPGQWSAVPKVEDRSSSSERAELSARMRYPDPDKDLKGFNPVKYPDLEISYVVRVRAAGASIVVSIDLDAPLPNEWLGRVAFNLELFPGRLFGKSYRMDSACGMFPRQANGPGGLDGDGLYHVEPLGVGRRLVIAPEDDLMRMVIETSEEDLELLDGRGLRDNGWFVVRTAAASGRAEKVIEWRITPNVIPGWISQPVVQVSQVGYHPLQDKQAIIELDPHDTTRLPVVVSRIGEDGSQTVVKSETPASWGRFLRFDYLKLDFTEIETPGLYVVRYGDASSSPFLIDEEVFARHVWQPTLEYFLPVQMCHMRITDRVRVWHGECHRDDARMAPTNWNHFDGYKQGPDTLCRFSPGDRVPGLNVGGWHDAGDSDLRIETQAATVYGLAVLYEEFGVEHDTTTIDQRFRRVELHRPDGKPDVLQQVEHGCLSIVAGYRALGRFYRGIICPVLRQYGMVGDPVNQTDNEFFDTSLNPEKAPPVGLPDDRWVFTEENPRHEYMAAAALAAAARVLRDLNADLSQECLNIAREIYEKWKSDSSPIGLGLCLELLITTGDRAYAESLVQLAGSVGEVFDRIGWIAARAIPFVDDDRYTTAIRAAATEYNNEVELAVSGTPYGVPYEPYVWGAGWTIQHFGQQQYFLHRAFPDLFPMHRFLHALDFVLGCHPGANTASFVSGVGTRSVTVAYGFNRADWTHIPGGIVSGTALVRPDFPELLEWPYLWQQTEYVLGGGTVDYLILVLGADQLLRKQTGTG